MMEITRRDEPAPPPKPRLPAIVETIQLVDNEIELEEIDFSVEFTEDTWIDFSSFTDMEQELIEGEVERYIVEIMPTFRGGNPSVEFTRYISSKMIYPEEAAPNGVKGRVYVKFVINSKGEPGIQSGLKVNVTYIFPINFVIH